VISDDRPSEKYLKIKTETTGFGSPAKDYVDKRLDLNQLINQDIMTTYFFRYAGEEKNNIHPGDIMVVDRSVDPQKNDLIITNKETLKVEEYSNQEKVWGTITWILSQRKK